MGAYCKTPQSAPLGLPAPLSGALFSLPPLGEVPRSGKGGAVGDFELLPFIEQHPLSQPCRFRSAVKSASSPIGEPSGLLRIRPGFHKAVSAYCETPLRLAKSRLTAVARLHGACGRTSQAPWACQLPFQGCFWMGNFTRRRIWKRYWI